MEFASKKAEQTTTNATKPNARVVQSKLTVNEPGDTYEQEADAMAERVMRMSSQEVAN